MWILPSRSRPKNIERLSGAWSLTGASTELELIVDDDDPFLEQYEAMEMPSGWHIFIGPRERLSSLYNAAYLRHPDESWYGFIADDVVPLTPGWDRRLIEVAGKDGMAIPAGGHDPQGAPHFVLGGDLVRSVGCLSLHGLDRLYIDTVWQHIARKRDVLRRCPEIVLEHRHFSNRKALFDETYRKRNKAKDKSIYDNWRHKHGYLP